MSAHWFSTLAFSIPGYFLDISICLELSYVSIFKHAFFFLPGFCVFSGKVSFISGCQVPQIQFLVRCSFYCKLYFLILVHFLLHT